MLRRDYVSGYQGVGKVKLVYKPKPVKRFPYGALLFGFGLSLLVFAYCWTHYTYRLSIVLPIFRFALKCYDGLLLNLQNSKKQIEFSSLKERVDISFNNEGVPTIRANNTLDLLFGQGYVHASHRLFQIDVNRMTARGRLSEHFGVSKLQTDRLMRAFDLYSVANSDLLKVNEVELSFIQAYANGLNAYIAQVSQLPMEYTLIGVTKIESFTAVDIIASLRLHSLKSLEEWDLQIIRMAFHDLFNYSIDDILPSTTGIYRENHLSSLSFFGAIVKGGDHADNTPILSIAGFFETESSSRYYLNSLTSPDLNVSGASIPGIPFVMSGTNQYVGWSTFCEFSNSDYLERLSDTSTDFQNKVEEILIKGDENDHVHIDYNSNGFALGRILSNSYLTSRNDKLYFNTSKVFHPLKIEALYSIARSNSWESFQVAATELNFLIHGFAFGDKMNNIGAISSRNSKVVFNPESGVITFGPNFLEPDDALQPKLYFTRAKISRICSAIRWIQTKFDSSAIPTDLEDFLENLSLKCRNPAEIEASEKELDRYELFFSVFETEVKSKLFYSVSYGSVASVVNGASFNSLFQGNQLSMLDWFDLSKLNQIQTTNKYKLTDGAGKTNSDLILDSLIAAFATCKSMFGSIQNWGAAKSLRFAHVMENNEYFGEVMSPQVEDQDFVTVGSATSTSHNIYGCLLARESPSRCRINSFMLSIHLSNLSIKARNSPGQSERIGSKYYSTFGNSWTSFDAVNPSKNVTDYIMLYPRKHGDLERVQEL